VTYAQGGVDANLVSADQLKGLAGVGWAPVADIHGPSPRVPSGEATCTALMKREKVDITTAAAKASAMASCDVVFLYKAVLDGIPAGQRWDRSTWGPAVERLGSFRSAALPLATYGPGKRFPITIAWPMAWDDRCTCVVYSGPSFAMR
jgi:hypothetical protein